MWDTNASNKSDMHKRRHIHYWGKKCNTFKDKFIVLQIDVTGSLSL